MKKLLLIILIIWAGLARGQFATTQFIGAPNTLLFNRGHFRTDSGFYAPIRDTTFMPARPGGLVYRLADNSFYQSISIEGPKRWQKLGGIASETDPMFSVSVAAQITQEDYDNWQLAHDKRPDSIRFSGTTTKTMTVYTQDGQNFTASFTDLQGTPTDTTNISNRINQKLNISDTGTMLNPYLRKADTAAMLSAYKRAYNAATLTDAATITWDYSTGNEKNVTIAGNRTLSITNLPADRVSYGVLRVVQDATGGRTITLPSGSKVGNNGAGAVVLTVTGGAVDILVFRYSPSASTFWWVYQKNFN